MEYMIPLLTTGNRPVCFPASFGKSLVEAIAEQAFGWCGSILFIIFIHMPTMGGELIIFVAGVLYLLYSQNREAQKSHSKRR